MATPSSRAVLRRPICSDSMSRLKGEYLCECQSQCKDQCDEGSHILNLNGINVLDFAGTPQGLGAALRETKILDLTLMLELLHLLDSLLDRSDLVQTVAVVEINVRHTKTSQ